MDNKRSALFLNRLQSEFSIPMVFYVPLCKLTQDSPCQDHSGKVNNTPKRTGRFASECASETKPDPMSPNVLLLR